MADNSKSQLAQALTKINRNYADIVQSEMTDLKKLSVEFLKHYMIYLVSSFEPMLAFYVGFAPKKPAFLLTGSPENYVQLAQVDGVKIGTPAIASQYAQIYLEVTRSMSELFYVVESMADVKFRPNLDSRDEAVKEAFIQRYQAVIRPAQAEADNNDYHVTIYAIREQALELHTLRVSKKGDIQAEFRVLEENLPLVYGL